MSQKMEFKPFNWSRRDVLKGGVAAGAVAAAGLRPGSAKAAIYTEAFPISPLIMEPFRDTPDNQLLPPNVALPVTRPVGPGHPSYGLALDPANHDSIGGRPHQVLPSDLPAAYNKDPLIYHLKMMVGTHSFTKSPVKPLDTFGNILTKLPAGAPVTLNANGTTLLPDSVIYGFAAFNGQDWVPGFPGAIINNDYGRPTMIRFENNLDQNPMGLDRQDFGAPLGGYHESPEKPGPRFLTHLHNGHTAPESDGNPHYQDAGYAPNEWFDALYLNAPAGYDEPGDEGERNKQSFLWFHDHQHGHTGANVFKGMVGLYPIYDPMPVEGFPDGRDPGDETKGLRLPGIRVNDPDGSFTVKYDIPLAFYDTRLDDGITVHHDAHTGSPTELHPEWWGKTFFRHFPNHGFMGDIFTVNCKAFPVLHVFQRKYRIRMLGASVSRTYEMVLMKSARGPRSSASLGYTDEELQGQYRIPDGQQCMTMTQIASEGGLLQLPIVRNTCEIWPGKRREFVIDFTKYMDGTPTKAGDAIYLTNILEMTDGRKPESGTRFGLDPAYKIPMLKIIIDGPPPEPDNSVMPTRDRVLRPLVALPTATYRDLYAKRRVFKLERGGTVGGEDEWLINGKVFDPHTPLAYPVKGAWEVWELQTGGGWTHPMHMHQEEHRVVMRDGKALTEGRGSHPDDTSREDVVALDPGATVVIARRFRSFTGPFVAHCHQLAHEDHSMMFGWTIVEPGDPRADYGKILP